MRLRKSQSVGAEKPPPQNNSSPWRKSGARVSHKNGASDAPKPLRRVEWQGQGNHSANIRQRPREATRP